MINSLTGLRFYAAFLVFVHHALAHIFGLHGPIIGSFGHLGVSIFFVLSGFVLYINYLPKDAQQIDIRNFYLARFARVYPVFLLTTLLAAPIQWLAASKLLFFEALLFNILALQAFHPLVAGTFNDVAWTICVEFTFYALFPVLATSIFLSKSVFRNLLIALGGYLVYLLTMQMLCPDSFYASPYFPVNRLAEFMIGMLGGYFYMRHPNLLEPFIPKRKAGISALLTLLVGLLVTIPLFTQASPALDKIKYIFYIIPSLWIILLLACTEKKKLTFALLASPLIIWGGEISYSFYLIHNLILRYLRQGLQILFHFDSKHSEPGLQIALFGLALFLALGAAHGLYQWIELPARKALRRQFSGTPKNVSQKLTDSAPLPNEQS